MEFPEPVIRVAIEPKTKAGPGEDGHRPRASWPRRIRPSRPIRTKRPARPSSPAWASCIWRSSSTGCCVSSRSRRTSVDPQVAYNGDHHARPPTVDTRYVAPVRRQRPVWLTSRSRLSPTSPARAMSSSTRIIGGAIPKEYIPCVDSGHPGRYAGRRAWRAIRLWT